ncbi:YtxH domain-containing protein [Candidatus Peregrinibacteria bacterium]|nr:YtxH domain-containing protein [Candidatus Peregrinibacteria bacterium]
MKKGKISLLLGLLGGTIFGVLFAPHRGKDVRDKMKKERGEGGSGLQTLKGEFTKMGEDIEDWWKDIMESPAVQSRMEGGKERFMEFAEEAEDELTKLSDNVKSKAEELKSMVNTYGKKTEKKARRYVKPAQKTVQNIIKKANEMFGDEEK